MEDLEQKKRKERAFFILQNVLNGMIDHMKELTLSKEDAWETLEKLYTSSTKPRKIQLKKKLNNMKKTISLSLTTSLSLRKY